MWECEIIVNITELNKPVDGRFSCILNAFVISYTALRAYEKDLKQVEKWLSNKIASKKQFLNKLIFMHANTANNKCSWKSRKDLKITDNADICFSDFTCNYIVTWAKQIYLFWSSKKHRRIFSWIQTSSCCYPTLWSLPDRMQSWRVLQTADGIKA